MVNARWVARPIVPIAARAVRCCARAAPVAAQEVTVLCNFEVDWCEALKATYERTTGQKAVFIRRTDGESLAQIRAEKANPRADIYHAAESASAKQLAAEGLLEAYKSPRVAELHDWAQRIAEENKYFQTPIYTGVLGWGYNTELLAKKKLPEPKCWADLVNPAYKDEIQMANPGTSGTAFNTVSTILQMMGEDQGFKFLAAMNKNVNQYTRSGSAGIRAAAKGETLIGITFLHDSVAQTVQGFPIKTIAPVRGNRLRDHFVVDHQERPQSRGREEMDGLRALAGGTERRGHRQQVPGSVEQERAGPSDGAEALGSEAHQSRPRQVRLEGRPRAPADALGERGVKAPK